MGIYVYNTYITSRYHIQTVGGNVTNEALGVFTAWSAGNNYLAMKFPVEMRVAPSASTTGDTGWTLLSATAQVATTDITVQGLNKKGCEINLIRSGSFTNGQSGWVRGTTATKISFSAEL